MDLAETVCVDGTRLAGVLWRRLPPSALDALSRRAARLDLAAKEPGGDRLIIARKH